MIRDNVDDVRIGFYICHCGVNISDTVNVEEVRDFVGEQPGVVSSRDYKFMCSNAGQELIEKDIEELKLNRVVVAACSPLMHEVTFRSACERKGLNPYLLQIANIREQCSWVHDDKKKATAKASALANAAIRRVALHTPLEPIRAKIGRETMIVGAGIAGIQAALEIAEAGHTVYLVDREPTVGGHMATFDKTFPTLDCAACILTPKMVSLSHRKNIKLLTYHEVADVSGHVGNFVVKLRRKPRFVDESKCTGCSQCWTNCPALRYPTRRRIKIAGHVVAEFDKSGKKVEPARSDSNAVANV